MHSTLAISRQFSSPRLGLQSGKGQTKMIEGLEEEVNPRKKNSNNVILSFFLDQRWSFGFMSVP